MKKLFAVGTIVVALTSCSQSPQVAEVNANAVPEPAKVAAKTEEPKKKIEWPWQSEEKVTIPAGTPLRVRTTSTISTESASSGEGFSANLAEPVTVAGKIIVPKDANLEGVVVNADDGGRVKGVATLSLRLTSLQAGGKNLPIESNLLVRDAPATKKKDAVTVGIGTGIGAAIGAIAGGGKGAAIGAASGAGAGTGVVLATHGKPAVVAAESLLSFRLTSPLTVTLP